MITEYIFPSVVNVSNIFISLKSFPRAIHHVNELVGRSTTAVRLSCALLTRLTNLRIIFFFRHTYYASQIKSFLRISPSDRKKKKYHPISTFRFRLFVRSRCPLGSRKHARRRQTRVTCSGWARVAPDLIRNSFIILVYCFHEPIFLLKSYRAHAYTHTQRDNNICI